MARAFTALNLRLDWRITIAVASLVAVGFYLAMSALTFRVGFPLDDTWIHLTYARNFAEYGEWAFRLGEKSAGSTAPLWTFLLSLGYSLNLAPYAWTFFLGWLVLTLLAIFAEAGARKLVDTYKPRLPWVGFFFALTWHLTWSAVSGMETLLHGLIIFVVLVALVNKTRRYLTLGLLAGLSVWVRPDGLTLLGPIIFTILLSEKDGKARGKSILMTMIGFGAFFLPYLLFNLAISGNPMPNTFYAKQAEYQAYWLGKPLAERVTNYLQPILASSFLVLIPGVILWIGGAVKNRNWGTLAGVIWFCGYIFLYFSRLPAYQHGRYIIPALPILYFWGVLGMVEFVLRVGANLRVVIFWKNTLVILSMAFTYLAAQQNANDVYWIESEMIETAKWVQVNVPADALLAVHDIGALGYYVPNPILDLAGLISPEVVPLIRDEARLELFLSEKSADYLIVFTSDYPSLTAARAPVFVAGQEPGPLTFENNMHVYFLK